jgi:hypothetical protein
MSTGHAISVELFRHGQSGNSAIFSLSNVCCCRCMLSTLTRYSLRLTNRTTMSSDAPGKSGVESVDTDADLAVLVGCIGGSGLYHLDNLTFV